MLSGLINAGFSVVGTWPIRTERGARTLGIGSNALASSIVLVCRPRPEDAPVISRRDFINALRRELPAALKEMQSGNIAPVDLAQASIGPGMAVYSRYSKVLEPNGERLTVRTALQLINQELDAYLAEQEGDVDPETRFAVAWFEQFGFREAGFGQADVLARAKNTSVEGMQNAGILTASAGKVKLIHWSELDPGWDPAADGVGGDAPPHRAAEHARGGRGGDAAGEDVGGAGGAGAAACLPAVQHLRAQGLGGSGAGLQRAGHLVERQPGAGGQHPGELPADGYGLIARQPTG